VVGYANKIAREVKADVCRRRDSHLPALFRRRHRGANAGGLNYSLVLKITPDGPTGNITRANKYIMERNRQALAAATGQPVVVRGHTDLTVGDQKFAGHSQRRHRRFLLFHGTILLHADLNLISELLPMPSLEPAYRAHRPHVDFVMNLHVSAESVKAALRQVWDAQEPLPTAVGTHRRPGPDKYSTPPGTANSKLKGLTRLDSAGLSRTRFDRPTCFTAGTKPDRRRIPSSSGAIYL